MNIYLDTITENFGRHQEDVIQFVSCLQEGDVTAEEHICSEFDHYFFNIRGIKYDLLENTD